MKLAPLLLLAFVLGAVPAQGQFLASPIASGTQVRVTAPAIAAAPIRGAFLSGERDTIRVATAGGSLVVGVPFAAIERLEVSRGRSRMRWAMIGAGTGAVAGLLIGAASANGGSGALSDSWAPLGGLLAGIPIGAVVGAIAAPERWREHPVALLR